MAHKSRVFNVTAGHIGRDANLHGGRPYILGTDVRVQDIYLLYEYLGVTAEEIRDRLQIPMVKVFAALTFAHDYLDYFERMVEQDQNNESHNNVADDNDNSVERRNLNGY